MIEEDIKLFERMFYPLSELMKEKLLASDPVVAEKKIKKLDAMCIELRKERRVNFRVPIVAKKFNPNGYYIPRNEEERNEGLGPYKRQILTEQKILSIIQSIDLEDFWKNKKAL